LPSEFALTTWILFICHSAQNILDTLLAKGFMARAAIGCGTLSDSSQLVLGTGFIDAYDHIEGERKLPLLATEATPEFLKYQNSNKGLPTDLASTVALANFSRTGSI
jgi:hypothetical protein